MHSGKRYPVQAALPFNTYFMLLFSYNIPVDSIGQRRIYHGTDRWSSQKRSVIVIEHICCAEFDLQLS